MAVEATPPNVVPVKDTVEADQFTVSVDSVLPGPNGLEQLGITPVHVASVLRACLGIGGERMRYDLLRQRAGR